MNHQPARQAAFEHVIQSNGILVVGDGLGQSHGTLRKSSPIIGDVLAEPPGIVFCAPSSAAHASWTYSLATRFHVSVKGERR